MSFFKIWPALHSPLPNLPISSHALFHLVALYNPLGPVQFIAVSPPECKPGDRALHVSFPAVSPTPGTGLHSSQGLSKCLWKERWSDVSRAAISPAGPSGSSPSSSLGSWRSVLCSLCTLQLPQALFRLTLGLVSCLPRACVLLPVLLDPVWGPREVASSLLARGQRVLE